MTDKQGAVPSPATLDAKAAWAGITDEEALRVAAIAVQMLADSEPNADMIEAQDRLAGTPQAHLFCVDAETLTQTVATAISNAAYDATPQAPTVTDEDAFLARELFQQRRKGYGDSHFDALKRVLEDFADRKGSPTPAPLTTGRAEDVSSKASER